MTETEAPAAEPAEGGRAGLMTRLNVLIFLVVVLTGEALIAYFFIPTAADVAAASGAKSPDAGSQYAPQDVPADLPGLELTGPNASLKEFDLDSYSLAVPNLAAGTSWRVDFHLWAIVHEDQEASFGELYNKHKHRIRDSVGTIIRRSEAADLAEAELGLIKRKISTKVNQTLGKPLLRGVVFSDFFFYQQ